MTAPTFANLGTILTGWVFAGRRTITGAIAAAKATKHYSTYHRVFALAQWSLDEFGLAVFLKLILPLHGDGVVFLAIDDTLARKRGRKVFGTGCHLDPLLSTRKAAMMNWGHSWVALGVIVEVFGRPFCLPVLFRLYVAKKSVAGLPEPEKAPAKKGSAQEPAEKTRKPLPKWKVKYRTRPELAVEMLQLLCASEPALRFHVVGDGAYSGSEVLKSLPANCDMTGKLSMDARLYDAPPTPTGKKGRPRLRGELLPNPKEMLKTRAKRIVQDEYGRHAKARIVDCIARTHAVPDRPLRVVASEPMSGKQRKQAFFSTCVEAAPTQVLTWYNRRWSVEETFHDAKGSLGFEEPQGWSRKAVERTAPMLMLLYSMVVVWFASEGHKHYRAPERPWYPGKERASFADMVATLRRESIKEQIFSMGLSGQGSRKIVETLLHLVAAAA